MAYQEVFKRVEMKYVLPPDRMSAVREAMEGRMALDRYGLSEIRNLYCDTPSWILARRSIEKPVYKEKVRVRSYGPASGEDTVFLELKKKYDGIVYKRRMALEPMNSYERHVIHTALQNYEGVTTSSTGVEPNRRVVVSYVKPDKPDNKPRSREWA